MTDSALPDVVVVSRDQVSAARALIRLRGGTDRVDPLIARIAEAEPAIAARQQQLLGLLADGLSDAAIAAELRQRVATVRNHVTRLTDLLGVATRRELVQRAAELRRDADEFGADPPSAL